MAGVVVCHGSAVVRERLVVTSIGVPALGPVRAAASVDELLSLARRMPPTVVLLDAHLGAPGAIEAIRRLRAVAPVRRDRAARRSRTTPSRSTGRSRSAPAGSSRPTSAAPSCPPSPRTCSPARRSRSPPAPRTATRRRAQPGGCRAALGRRAASRRRARDDANAAPVGAPTSGAIAGVPLTKREIEVLVGMSNGRSNAQIGAELYLSEDTVKTHARRLFRKLGANDRAQAVAIGLRRGLIQ